MKKSCNTSESFRSVLKSLGFESYKDYLASPLWRSIRAKKLRISGKCYFCRSRASQVHHVHYTRRNLSGKSLKGLHSLCGHCHHEIEFEGDRKRTLGQAQAKFYEMRRDRKKEKKEQEDWGIREERARQETRELYREFFAIVRKFTL